MVFIMADPRDNGFTEGEKVEKDRYSTHVRLVLQSVLVNDLIRIVTDYYEIADKQFLYDYQHGQTDLLASIDYGNPNAKMDEKLSPRAEDWAYRHALVAIDNDYKRSFDFILKERALKQNDYISKLLGHSLELSAFSHASLLITNGADVDYVDESTRYPMTFLMRASARGNAPVVNFLLAANANPIAVSAIYERQDFAGYALDYALLFHLIEPSLRLTQLLPFTANHFECVTLLLQHSLVSAYRAPYNAEGYMQYPGIAIREEFLRKNKEKYGKSFASLENLFLCFKQLEKNVKEFKNAWDEEKSPDLLTKISHVITKHVSGSTGKTVTLFNYSFSAPSFTLTSSEAGRSASQALLKTLSSAKEGEDLLKKFKEFRNSAAYQDTKPDSKFRAMFFWLEAKIREHRQWVSLTTVVQNVAAPRSA
ncbi:hypothetical protein AYO45_03770 [Gammaproteobacteria bacterium SCGC AG-212-F23]|nr:hypothetical protein AYO45_03770 [Gammaproteobacteria bacterium SCGC AG-212-F23]